MKVIEIKKTSISKKAISFKWDDKSTDFIEKLSQKWLDDNYAESILFFFNSSGKKLHAFMILNPTSSKQLLKREKEELNIIEAKSISLENSSLTKEDKNYIDSIMKEKYHWTGGEIFRISNQGGIQDQEKLEILLVPHRYNASSFTTEHESPHFTMSGYKKPSAKKTGAKKTGAKKKAGSSKAGVKKTTAKKTGAKKTTTKKTGVKRSGSKFSLKRKSSSIKRGVKTSGKKSGIKKSVKKSATSKKSSGHKIMAKKSGYKVSGIKRSSKRR